MFICASCRDASGLYERFAKSLGHCEVCGNTAVCDDWPTVQIPADVPLKSAYSPSDNLPSVVSGDENFAVVPQADYDDLVRERDDLKSRLKQEKFHSAQLEKSRLHYARKVQNMVCVANDEPIIEDDDASVFAEPHFEGAPLRLRLAITQFESEGHMQWGSPMKWYMLPEFGRHQRLQWADKVIDALKLTEA